MRDITEHDIPTRSGVKRDEWLSAIERAAVGGPVRVGMAGIGRDTDERRRNAIALLDAGLHGLLQPRALNKVEAQELL